ncbi:MAG: aspartate kinase [Gammaproteobacteria bacterium]|nr:aspartate kinase [Gammaproteobacteria bacterium]
MSIIVEKYGGTSVGSIERINAVAEKVSKSYAAGDQMVIVVSAMSGETNRLLEMAKEINPHLPAREADVLVSTGEQVTIALLCMALIKRGLQARSYTGGQVRIETDTSHGRARIRNIDDSRIRRDLDEGKIIVVAGYQGVDNEGNITTLGRGGSDVSAVALAAALKALECRIYTDVDGVYTADPRIVPEARRMDEVTFEEMLELSSLGAKVLQIRSVEFAGKYKVPLRVLSSFEDGPGTLISYEVKRNMERAVIAGIAHNADEAKLTITGVPDHPGVAHTILGRIAKKGINVDMIIQNVAADKTTDFTFTVPRTDYENAKTLLKKVSTELAARGVTGDNTIAKVSVVGVGMRSHTGVADLMFATLAQEGINIRMISTSEIKVSVIIDDKYTELAVRALHKAFELDQKK